MSLYSLKALFTKNPIQISGVVMSAVNLALIVDLISMSADGVAALNLFLTGALGLFVVQNTVNTTSLGELSDDKGATEIGGILTIAWIVFLILGSLWFCNQLWGWFA